jgi:hypothetical protein
MGVVIEICMKYPKGPTDMLLALIRVGPLGHLMHTYFYNHARHLHLKQNYSTLPYLELFSYRSPSGHF